MKTIALVGNPNAGKTTLFNALTGLRQKVGNYPGITVERKAGSFRGLHGEKYNLVDLPGAYSLSSRSPDEAVTRESLMGLEEKLDHPDLLIIVADASNLDRHLYLATQVIELNIPCVLVLNMMDLQQAKEQQIKTKLLAEKLGVPVIAMSAIKKEGLTELKTAISQIDKSEWVSKIKISPVPETVENVLRDNMESAKRLGICVGNNDLLRLLYLAINHDPEHFGLSGDQVSFIESLKTCLTEKTDGWEDQLIANRYNAIDELVRDSIGSVKSPSGKRDLTDALDAWLLHPILGWGILISILVGIFFLIFSFAQVPMGWVEAVVGAASGWAENGLKDGDLRDLIIDGVFPGIEGVIIFLPQIIILFFFICLMEETGYMARVAFMMDRVMSKVGLNGKSFVPLLSSYACAVPGVMAARTIENPKDRLITILIVPLASCSARLPVYLIMIAMLVPEDRMSVWLKIQILLGLYITGTLGAFLFALLFRKVFAGGVPSPMVLELPSYRMPRWNSIFQYLWEKSWVFIKRAGTIILGLSILLWAAVTYPKIPSDKSVEGGQITESQKLEYSFAGRVGKIMEPVVAPLGYDWKIGIGVLTSFAAREVFVSTMAIIYSVEEAGDDDQTRKRLRDRLAQEKTKDGEPVFTPLVCVSLMVFYIFAMQCISTIAVVKKETGGWKWPVFQLIYMTLTAYLMSLAVFQGGKLLGLS